MHHSIKPAYISTSLLQLLISPPSQSRTLISYNPYVVGARDLLEKGCGAPLSLAPLNSDQATTTETDHLRQTIYLTLVLAILTIPVLIIAWAPLPPHKIHYGSSSFTLATLVQFIVAGPFYPKVLKALLAVLGHDRNGPVDCHQHYYSLHLLNCSLWL